MEHYQDFSCFFEISERRRACRNSFASKNDQRAKKNLNTTVEKDLMKKPFTIDEKVWYIHSKIAFSPEKELNKFLDELESGNVAKQLDENTLTRIADFTYSIRFLRLLTTKWVDTDAYKKGIIDDQGIPLKRLKDLSPEEKSSYNMFHRIVFFIKRLLNKIPFIGKHILSSYATAFLMIKEETGMSEEEILGTMRLFTGENVSSSTLMNESFSFITLDNRLKAGRYYLINDVLSYGALKERTIPRETMLVQSQRYDGLVPYTTFMGVNFYKIQEESTGIEVLVTKNSIIPV